MAGKCNSRFAVPSRLDSDDDEDEGKSTRDSRVNSKFEPGQLFARAKNDRTTTTTTTTTMDDTSATTTKMSSASKKQASSSSSTARDTSNALAATSIASAPSSSIPNSASISAPSRPASSASASSSSTASSTASSTSHRSAASAKNAIIVNPKQRGNPILKHVTNVAYEYGDIVPDYQVGSTSCVLYLSLRYHNLNPEYIQKRLDALRNMYELRILLVQVDVKDPHHSLKELALLCILTNSTLIVAWSPEEAGRYLETYKIYENKPPDAIMSRPEGDFQGRVADALTTVKGVNKTDAATLLATFDSFASVVKADEDKLLLCPGLGPLKAKRLHRLFEAPFVNWK